MTVGVGQLLLSLLALLGLGKGERLFGAIVHPCSVSFMFVYQVFMGVYMCSLGIVMFTPLVQCI